MNKIKVFIYRKLKWLQRDLIPIFVVATIVIVFMLGIAAVVQETKQEQLTTQYYFDQANYPTPYHHHRHY